MTSECRSCDLSLQGMNMLVAIALLFLDEETAFWYIFLEI